MKTMKRNLLFAAIATALPLASAQASVIVLDFENINSSYPTINYANIQEFYNGGTSSQGTSGTNFGVSFEDNARAIRFYARNGFAQDGRDVNPTSGRPVLRMAWRPSSA